jgi:hypothetical protein
MLATAAATTTIGGPTTEFIMRVSATEQQWPNLSAKLRKFGAEYGLAVFDTSMRLDWVHMIEVSLCGYLGRQSVVSRYHA